jgi:N-acetylglucosaminyl-diphospho-decaprenol L-rhamnosyltransferase
VTGRFADTVSAVIVSYHTGAPLWACLDRVLADPAIGEILLVDNGNDAAVLTALCDRAAQTNKLRILSGHGNIGFAAGCNLGARAASRRFLLLLNPDCLIEPDSVAGLLGAVEAAPRSGDQPWIATVRLVDAQGVEQPGSRRNEGTPLQCLAEALQLHRLLPPRWAPARLNLADQSLPTALTAVPAISGAFMLMARATFDALGGMDEGYFLHVEDLDFCLRLARSGGVAYFLPGLTATHMKGTSATTSLFVERHKARGFHRYFRRHFAPALVGELCWLVLAAGLFLRGWIQDRGHR